MLTWLAGPSKGLLLIARREGYLPPFFQHQNENEVAVNILVVQGAVTTVIALLYALVPSVSSAYWILSVMTTQIYLIVYLLMFVAARQPAQRQPDVERGYTAPTLKFLCTVGFLASAAAILIGFVPPSQFENGSDGALRRADPRRHRADRPAPAVVVPAVPQAQLEVHRHAGGDVMSAAAPTSPHAGSGSGLGGSYWSSAPSSSSWRHRADHLRVQSTTAEAQQKAAAAHPEAGGRRAARARQRTSSSAPSAPTAGASATTPRNALGRATLHDQLTNGAAYVGRRPVIVDRRVIAGRGADPGDLLPGQAREVP